MLSRGQTARHQTVKLDLDTVYGLQQQLPLSTVDEGIDSLTLTTLKYLYINHGDHIFFNLQTIIVCCRKQTIASTSPDFTPLFGQCWQGTITKYVSNNSLQLQLSTALMPGIVLTHRARGSTLDARF